MSHKPKFADPTQFRTIYGSPTFKYLLAITLAFGGCSYGVSYYVHSLMVKDKLEELNSKYTYIGLSRDVATNMVMEKVLFLKYWKKLEEEAKNK